ncbi:MAG: isochorismate synthase [bacterium]
MQTTSRADRYRRITIRIPDTDPLLWLAHQTIMPQLYWKARDGSMEVAAVGWAATADGDDTAEAPKVDLSAITPDTRVWCLGRFDVDFPQSSDGSWAGFPQRQVLLPLFELERDDNGCRLTCNLAPSGRSSSALNTLDAMTFVADRIPSLAITAKSSRQYPDRERWEAMIGEALAAIDREEVVKIVLARTVEHRLSRPVVAAELLSTLIDQADASYQFLYQSHSSRPAFVGVTPERLYRREGRKIVTEAMAGTIFSASDDANSHHVCDQLLNSDKDIREQRLVVDGIIRSLRALGCEQIATEALQTRNCGHVFHLVSRISALLPSGVDDLQLISELSPTPAVCGWPREAALKAIGRLEPFDRGWYGGPVGWITKDRAEFAVGIRSALVEQDLVRQYVGAGIVAGSTADGEWAETQSKLKWAQAILSNT